MSIRDAVRDTFRRFISANLIAPDPHPEPALPDPPARPLFADALDDVTTEHAFGAAATSADEAMVMALGAMETGTLAQAQAILDGYLSAHPLSIEEQATAATTAGQTPLYDQMADRTVHMQSRDILGPLGEDPHIFADKVERDLANIPANTIAAILRGEQ